MQTFRTDRFLMADHFRQSFERVSEERRKLAEELDQARQAFKRAARGAITVDGSTLVFLLLTTKLLPTDEGTQKAIKLLRKRAETTPVRLEIAEGRLTIADPAGKWSRVVEVEGAAQKEEQALDPGSDPSRAVVLTDNLSAPRCLQPQCRAEERADVKPVPAAPPIPAVADQELQELCTTLAERPLHTPAACLGWLREEAQRRTAAQQAQAAAPAGLRLVYSAPKAPGLQQPRPVAPRARPGKVPSKGPAWRPSRRQRELAGDWDW